MNASRKPHAPPVPHREKTKPRPRGHITVAQLRRSECAVAVRADIMQRLQQHLAEDTLPRGPRGLFYDLRPSGFGRGVSYQKQDGDANQMIASAKYVAEQLADMRRALLPDGTPMLPEEWITDGRVPDPVRPFEFADADEFDATVESWIAEAKLLRQDGQPAHLEVWCEAADLMPRVARICEGRGVTVFSGSGTDGLKAQKAVATRAARRGVPTVVGHIGDRDEKGEDSLDALAENGWAFLQHLRSTGEATARSDLEFRRLALTATQAAEHDLLDEQGKGEVDGLPVLVLDAIIRSFIDAEQDAATFEATLAREEEFLADLRRRHSNG